MPLVDAAATNDPRTGEVSISVVNGSKPSPSRSRSTCEGLPALHAADALVL